MEKKYEGIVINTVDYKETSKIINVFTKEDGIIGIIANGAKKPNNKTSSISNVLSYANFYVTGKNEKNLLYLKEGQIINNFKNIKKDIFKTNYAVYLLELTSKAYKNDNNKEIYKLLISGLNKINENFNEKIIKNIIELKLLEYLGILPSIEKCVTCGNKKDIITISSYKGGYICKNCVTDDKIYNIKTIKLIRMFYYVDIDRITKLEISKNIEKEIQEFLDDYYDRYAGIYIKSKTFLKELEKI